MAVHVRMREAWMQLRMGEDAAVDGATAQFLRESGKAWITGGDPTEMTEWRLAADEEIGPPIAYPPRGDDLGAAVTRAPG